MFFAGFTQFRPKLYPFLITDLDVSPRFDANVVVSKFDFYIAAHPDHLKLRRG
jgi:hypothetical protein